MNNTNRKYLVDGVATVRLPKVMKYYDSTGNELIPVRHGRWIERECSYADVYRYECSECGFSDEHNKTREVPYCWHCGAKMDAPTQKSVGNALEALDEWKRWTNGERN